MTQTLNAGVAKVDITPPLTIPYLGYDPRHADFIGVHDPLYARALAVDDGATQAVVIAADAIGYNNGILGPGRDFTAEVRRRIEARSGVPAGNIMLISTHAHSTPETLNFRSLRNEPAAEPWLEVLIDQLASAATMALRGRVPSTLRVGIGQVEGMSWSRRIVDNDGRLHPFHRRPPDLSIADWGTVDNQVSVCLFSAVRSGKCVVLANFACHPITVQVQPLVSADFPGAAMRLVEQSIPCCEGSIFLQGACGDQNPVRGDTREFEDVERYGLMLGGEVIKLVGKMGGPDYVESRPLVGTASDVIRLPFRDLPSRRSAEDAYDAADRGLSAAVSEGERARFSTERCVAEDLLALIDRATEPLLAEVQVLRVGDAAFIGLPGEPFVELGLDIKRRVKAPYPCVLGYTNNYLGYFATPAAWRLGGYEVGYGPWALTTQEGSLLLVDKAVELTGKVWG